MYQRHSDKFSDNEILSSVAEQTCHYRGLSGSATEATENGTFLLLMVVEKISVVKNI